MLAMFFILILHKDWWRKICFEDIKSTFEGICPKKFTISTYMSFETIFIKIHISYCQEQPLSQVVTSRQTTKLMMFVRHPQILTKKIIKHLPFLVFPWKQEFNKNWFSFYWILSKSSMIHNFETIPSALFERQ